MRLELYIDGELTAEMVFRNIKPDFLCREKYFNRRKELIESRIKELKKLHLRGRKSKRPYQIYFIHTSRAYCTNIKFFKSKATPI